MDDEGILNLVINEDAPSEEEEDSEEVVTTSIDPQPSVSHAEAFRCFDIGLKWIRSLPEATPEVISQVVQLRELAAGKRESARKQPTILSFFGKNNS